MLFVPESIAGQLVTIDDAIDVVERVFIDMAQGRSLVFPAAQGHACESINRFGVKLGLDGSLGQAGLKVGSYWPGNRDKGMPNHGSTTLLIDPETGQVSAVVGSVRLTGLRTAAADAVAVRALSRPESTVLAVIGAGHQAFFDAVAISRVRPLSEVTVSALNRRTAEALAARLIAEGLPARPEQMVTATARADLVVTATPANQAFLIAEHVSPGTHISAMGADRPGKQELGVDLLATARLFADDVAQSGVIGEFQSLKAADSAAFGSVVSIGDVLTGAAKGRRRAQDITVFDSSGVALQDIALAALVLQRARDRGVAVEVND